MPWRNKNPFQAAEDLLARFPIPRHGPWVVAGRLALAPGIYLVLMLLVFLFTSPAVFYETLTRTLLTYVIGKFSAAGAASVGEGDFLYWVFMIGTVDVLTGLFLVWNFDLLYRVPFLGPLLRVMEAKGLMFLDANPWVRRVAFLGVVLIVIVPFQGTGAVMGSIVGRLIGLGPWRTLGAIFIGGYIGVTLVLSASLLVKFLRDLNLWIALALVAAFVVAGFAVWHRWFRTPHREENGEKEVAAEDGETRESGSS